MFGSAGWLRAGLSLPPVGSLRWLVMCPSLVCVRGPGVGGRRRSAFVCACPGAAGWPGERRLGWPLAPLPC